jgi:hypothetical protein
MEPDLQISPRGVPQITVYPPVQAGMGGWATWSPPTPPATNEPAQSAQENGGWGAWSPPENKPPTPDQGPMVAAGRGALEGLTFGTAPAIAGLSAASGMQTAQPEGETTLSAPGVGAGAFSTAPASGVANIAKTAVSPFVGAYRLATGAPGAYDAYSQGRQAALETQQQAQQQHPYAYGAGQVGAIAATLPFTGGAGGAATTLGRIAQSAKAGAIGGGAFGAGEAVSEGGGVGDVAKGAAGGAAAGAVLGGAAGSAIETGSRIAGRVGSVVRGARNPDAEASRIVRQGLVDNPQGIQQRLTDREAVQAGREAGTPTAIVDYGGEPSQARLRSAANISPAAREHINEFVGPRFEQQNERIAGWLRSRYGAHGGTDIDTEALRLAAKRANAPAYRRAYLAGDRRFPSGVWSDRLEQLLGSNAVPRALEQAMVKGRDRAVAEGMGAFNPKVVFENGILKRGGRGVPSFPDMQLWDYTQRALRDMAQSAMQRGERDEAGALFGLHSQLLDELDQLVPEFGAARGQAAAFFHASDTLEAGYNFVTDNAISDEGAARMIARMNPAERALFARGFATRLAEQIERTSYNRNVLNGIFLNSPRATRRIQIALGGDGAGEFEALMRIEEMVDRTRRALGNSTTVRQGNEAHLAAGAGAAGLAESLHGALNPVYLIAGAFVLGGRAAAKQIDERVALRVAQMLTSRNPAILQRGYAAVARNPVLRDALRRASDVGVRELINAARPSGVAAGAGALYEHFRPGVDVAHPSPPPNDQSDYDATDNRVQ